MSTNRRRAFSYRHLCMLSFVLLSLFYSQRTVAQDYYWIELKVVSCYNNYQDGDSKGSRYRFAKEITPGSNTWSSIVGGGCISGGINTTFYPNRLLYSFSQPVTYNSLNIMMGTHHERKDGSDGCTAQGVSGVTFNHPDLWNMDQVFTINLSNIPPGVFTTITNPTFQNVNGRTASAVLQIRYSIIRPDKPVLKDLSNSLPGANLCPNQLYTLKTKTPHTITTGVKYRWEYMISTSTQQVPNPDRCEPDPQTGGCGYWDIDPWDGRQVWVEMYCCDLPPYVLAGTWVQLTNTLPQNMNNPDSIVFNPFANIFGNSLSQISQTKSVYFRVRAYNETQSLWSDAMSLSFSPPPPSLPEVPVTALSCPTSPTGSITINNISGVGNYTYMLNAGYDNTILDCDPSVQNCVGFSIRSGYFSGSSLTLPNLAPGEYTLRIANPGDSLGTCSAYQNIKVDSFPTLRLTVVSYSPSVSCFGATDGTISLSSTGGNPTGRTYSIKNTVTSVVVTNATGNFTGVVPGNYAVYVTDGCNQKVEEIIVIGEPTRVEGVPALSQPTCTSPINGKISVVASKGGGIYNYLLTKNGSAIASFNSTHESTWEVANLSAGGYELTIKDAERTSCAGYTYNFTINPAAQLQLALMQNRPVTCFGAGDGQIILQAAGGQSSYRYFLIDNATQQAIISTDGGFYNLVPGSYTAYVKNADPVCNDSLIYPNAITIVQPAKVVMAFDMKYVVCKGQNNGSLTLTSISGGTGPFTYKWQQNLNGSWFDYTANGQGNSTSITNLYPGVYRLEAKGVACKDYSEELIVKEPDYDLILSSIAITDIKCLGTSGSIVPVPAGGHGLYTYYYTPSGGSPTQYNPLTYGFGIGTYTVKVKDSMGCEVAHPAPVTITSPSTALAFTYTLSTYGTFNVSCFGNLNGSITVNATGGNGGSYSGYEYALSANGPWQTSNVLSGLGAGAKTIYVRDGRGCVVTQNVTLTQPASIINGTLTSTNPTCTSDSTGSITVTTSGGVPPYQYRMIRAGTTGAWWENWQSSNVFNRLLWGSYSITVRDANGCTRVLTRLLTYRSTGPVLAANVQNIVCFGANTGSIALTVTGINKVTPYGYTWTGVTSSTPAVSALAAGTYSVRVTDSLGCRKDTTMLLTQPAELQSTANTRPICVGATDGRITLTATGGVSPYTYSVNNGSVYQSSNEFAGLTAGTYLTRIKDASNCTDTLTVPLITRNMGNTFTNFLVSSRLNAYDTLVVKEVCNPRPDSVKWVFDPAAVILDNDQYAPRIRFNSPGTYRIKMIPYFGGCDLPKEKDIVIKPFDSTIVYTPTIAGIDTVMIMPNPNNGQFSLQVKLFQQQKLTVYIRSVTGALIYYRQWNSVKEIMETINLNSNGFTPAGTYFLKVLTDNDARDKIIIKQ